jgi:hypothetical protein
MSDSQTPPRRKNTDVQCLKCGAFNITDNRICGQCGANLPVIYDDQGQVFRWEDAQGYEGLLHKPEPKGSHPSVNKTGWILRVVILLTAVLFAIYILNRHH